MIDLDNRDEVMREYLKEEGWWNDFEDLSESDKDRIEELTLYHFFKLRLAFRNLGMEIKNALKIYKGE